MKRACFNLCCMLLLSFLLILSACKPDPIPQAAAPSSHTWAAEPVLVSLFTATNNTRRFDYEWSKLPDLVVYADGRVFITRENPQRVIYEAHLQPAEICSLLQQIATDGFWDLQQKDYKTVEYADLQTIWIGVNAWQREEVSVYGLEIAPSGTPVPSAFKTTYLHLRDYAPPNLEIFQPDRLAVSVLERDQQQTAVEWPLQKPRLADLRSRENGNLTGVVIDGQEASDIYKLFTGDFTRTYQEDGKIYELTIRPLLPFEIWESNRNWTRPPVFQQTPTSELKCPAD